MYGSNITDSYGMIYTTKKNFNIRSPDRTNDNRVYSVYPDGDFHGGSGWYGTNSYGRKIISCSPDLDDYGSDYWAYNTHSNGAIGWFGKIVTEDSYGIFYFSIDMCNINL